MNSKYILNEILSNIGVSQKNAAASVGWKAQVLNHRLMRDSLRLTEFLKIMDAVGVEVIFRVKETGRRIVFHPPGQGPRVKGISEGIKYDTAMATPVANNFYPDGKNLFNEDGEAQELYVDDEGRYFFAVYSKETPDKGRVIAVPASIAAAFIEKHGNDTIE